MKQIYLDNAATTPTDPRVVEAMLPYFTDAYGNAGSIHEPGRIAKKAVDGARTVVARALGCKTSEIIFTSGGTESVNMSVLGGARANQVRGKSKGHIITTNIEHHAVLHACEALDIEGYDVTYLPVNSHGLISIEQISNAIRSDTILVSVMYANNEIGTIMPIAQIGKALKSINAARQKNHLPQIVFHSDACQAAGYLNINVNDLGVDLMTINGSKIYGPKGTGILYIKTGVTILPLLYGGGQERGLRPGTENVAGIVGIATALEIAKKEQAQAKKNQTQLRDYFIGQLQKKIKGIIINGDLERRLPNNINISIKDIEGESVLLYLDAKSIYCSTASACNSTNLQPSHVILALGVSRELAHGTLRFSLGKHTTKKDIDYTVRELIPIVKKLRSISAISP